MRSEVVKKFVESIEPFLDNINSVAIVGGSLAEPEILELQEIKEVMVDVYGVEESEYFFDLNKDNRCEKKYDLVLCSQVMEHIWNIEKGVENLKELTKVGGLLWLGCPASNRSHGSPDYYSAGYQPELFVELFKSKGWEIIIQGRLGAARLYFMTHALRFWPNEKELKRPISSYDFSRLPGPHVLDLLRFLRDLPGRFYSLTLSPEISDEVEFATETYLLIRRPSNLLER